MVSGELEMFIDPSRCIGCQACVHACSECETHRGHSMIHLEYVDRVESTQTVPVVCMHCDDPTCAAVCPADAIKKTADGVVQTANSSRCVGCSNCVLACPFGVPEKDPVQDLMLKCDMCYDRTSIGLRPMCATVCPSGAIAFRTREDILEHRRETPINVFNIGPQSVTTKVQMMMPDKTSELEFDVAALLPDSEQPEGNLV
jgi:Fe-S-cluster-containing dehydrogenase component